MEPVLDVEKICPLGRRIWVLELASLSWPLNDYLDREGSWRPSSSIQSLGKYLLSRVTRVEMQALVLQESVGDSYHAEWWLPGSSEDLEEGVWGLRGIAGAYGHTECEENDSQRVTLEFPLNFRRSNQSSSPVRLAGESIRGNSICKSMEELWLGGFT